MTAEALSETHYEVHLLSDGRWLVDRVLMQRDAAFLAAREVARVGDALGVRIVKECYRPASGQSTAVTLYEHLRPARTRPPLVMAQPTAPTARVSEPAPAEPPGTDLAVIGWKGLASYLSIAIAAALTLAIALLLLFR